jgi:hypothetical protein
MFSGNVSSGTITISLLGKPVSDLFDVNAMTWGSGPSKYHVRRNGGGATLDSGFKVMYWDDMCWAEFDPRAAVQVGDAVQFKRSKTCIYTHGVGYDIDLIAGTQTSRLSGRPRPLKIIDAPTVFADTVAPISGSWIDEESIPPEMMCPISRAAMTQPVVAEDGFTYQADQIQVWMKKKATSPMTGNSMGHTLIANHTLKALIQAEMDKQNEERKAACQARLHRARQHRLLRGRASSDEDEPAVGKRSRDASPDRSDGEGDDSANVERSSAAVAFLLARARRQKLASSE